MERSPVYWILDIVPLVALLLIAAFMYAHRNRRDLRLQTRPGRQPSGPAFSDFSARSIEMAKFRGLGSSDTSNGDAWNALHSRLSGLSEREHARLIALYEQGARTRVRRGEVRSSESYRPSARYDLERHATDHGDVT